jgi:mannosyltransferase OCH1-like enzyme
MKTFDEMIRGSYDFNADSYFADPRWAILERLYSINYLFTNTRKHSGIPRKIHQIWLGSELPEEYKKWTNTWKMFNPEWEYKLWGDKDVDGLNLPNRKLYDSIRNKGQQSDFLRYHILNQFGGIYVDTDFECLKSFDSLSFLSFFTGVGFPARVELYIGIIGSEPHHPIIEQICNDMTEVREGGWREVFETTGAYFFTRTFFKAVGNFMNGVVAFPIDFFYPFPNQSGHEKRDGRDFIKENSYAIHHWAVSWLKK